MKLAEFLDTNPNQNPFEASPLSDFLLKHLFYDQQKEINPSLITGIEFVLLMVHEHSIPEDLGAIIRGEE